MNGQLLAMEMPAEVKKSGGVGVGDAISKLPTTGVNVDKRSTKARGPELASRAQRVCQAQITNDLVGNKRLVRLL